MTGYALDEAILYTSLKKFIPHQLHEEFTHLLIKHRALVAGSWALHLVESSQHENGEVSPQPKWEPLDMDIWIPSKRGLNKAESLHRFFERNGKEVVDRAKRSNTSQSKVYQIGTKKHIELINIECDNDMPEKLTQMFDFNICVCYWDGKALYAAYIQDILSRKMYNIDRADQEDPKVLERQAARKVKYESRGFHFDQHGFEDNLGIFTCIQVKPLSNDGEALQRLEAKFITYKDANQDAEKLSPPLLTLLDFLMETRTQLANEIAQLHTKLAFSQKLSEEAQMMVQTIANGLEDEDEVVQSVVMATSHAKKLENATRIKLKMLQAEWTLLECKLNIDGTTTINESSSLPQCRICYSASVENSLPCGHMFCGDCVQKQRSIAEYGICSYCQQRYKTSRVIKLFAP